MLSIENFAYSFKAITAGVSATEFESSKDDRVVAMFEGAPILKRGSGRQLSLPALQELDGVTELIQLGNAEGRRYFTGVVNEMPPDFITRDVRFNYRRLHPNELTVVGMAQNLMHWHQHTMYCGRCAARTVFAEQGDFHKRCNGCSATYYPKLSPAVIMRVQKDNQILLARGPRLPPGMYSVLAGFVNIGESLEQAVKREVFEEVGLKVNNVRYFKSQPWPFPDSLMLAFTADYESGDFKLEEEEISEARWFTAGNLPPIPPEISVARALIDDFVQSQQTESQ